MKGKALWRDLRETLQDFPPLEYQVISYRHPMFFNTRSTEIVDTSIFHATLLIQFKFFNRVQKSFLNYISRDIQRT